MSMGQDTEDDGRSEKQIEAASQVTRRMLLRGVAYQAISWAWPPLALMKHKGRKEITAAVRGDVVSVVWRRKQQRRRQALLSTIFR